MLLTSISTRTSFLASSASTRTSCSMPLRSRVVVRSKFDPMGTMEEDGMGDMPVAMQEMYAKKNENKDWKKPKAAAKLDAGQLNVTATMDEDGMGAVVTPEEEEANNWKRATELLEKSGTNIMKAAGNIGKAAANYNKK
eukprot:gene28326-31446_t